MAGGRSGDTCAVGRRAPWRRGPVLAATFALLSSLLLSVPFAPNVAAAGWGTAEPIETNDMGSAEYPQVAVDRSGNAVAVWRQHDGTRYNAWANRYVVGSGWGTAELIETNDAGDVGYPFAVGGPEVAVAPDGDAVAVWDQPDGSVRGIWANRYVVGSGWGTAELLETDDVGNAALPQVGVDADGNAVAVWGQYGGDSPYYGTRYDIVASRYVVGMGWGTPELIETGAGNADFPQVSVDANGRAVVAWRQQDGSRRWNVWANRYVVGSGWETAQLVEANDGGDAAYPQVGVDARGNAVAVWARSNGTVYSIWANRYVLGSGWGTATLIERNDAGEAFGAQLAVTASGDAIAVWFQEDALLSTHIWANKYVAGSGWGTAELIEPHNPGGAWSPQVAADAKGNAVVVWWQYDGARTNIWANRYAAPGLEILWWILGVVLLVIPATVALLLLYRRKRKVAVSKVAKD